MKEVDAFLKKELLEFAKIAGRTNMPSHKSIMEDDGPIKQ